VRTLLVFRAKDFATIRTGELSRHMHILNMSSDISCGLIAEWAVSTSARKVYKTAFLIKIVRIVRNTVFHITPDIFRI